MTRTIISDHDLIKITTNIEDNKKYLNERGVNENVEGSDLQQLNFHSEKVPWSLIKQIIKEIDWYRIFEGRNNDECMHIFMIIKKICFDVILKK